MVYTAGTTVLECPYCGTTRAIPRTEAEVLERDLQAELAAGMGSAPTLSARAVDCDACGASSRLGPGVTASRCAFCDAPIVHPPRDRAVLAPQALLPFGVEREAAREAFAHWLKSRWFAPSDLVRRARKDGLDGVYLPFFTFDAATETVYTGERGDHYYETETYTEVENGVPVQKTRSVQRTRWSPRSGTVGLTFDDVLVLASRGLPEALVRKLEPWDLQALQPYQEAYLSGFRAECDQRGLVDGFDECKNRCSTTIHSGVQMDIGGNEQRIHWMRTAWTDLTYKHVLLPVWVGAFRYGEKVYRVVVNARTDEVQGERPWSAWKIASTVGLVAAVLTAVVYFAQSGR